MKRLVDKLKGNIPKGNTCVAIYDPHGRTSVILEILDAMTGKSTDITYIAPSIEEARKEIKRAGYKVQEFRDIFEKGNVCEMWWKN